jgi:hypothetical protein
MRGKPLGAPFEAHARALAPGEESLAERTLARRYGLGRQLFEGSMDLLRVDMCFLEITPGGWGQGPAPASRDVAGPRAESDSDSG